MCVFGKPDTPQPQAIEAPPSLVSDDVTRARNDTKRKAKAASGAGSTNRTPAAPNSTAKTLLGQ